MKTKISISLAFAVIFTAILFSCKKDDLEKEKPIPPHNFLNRPLSGIIDSKVFTFVSGSKQFPFYTQSISLFHLTNSTTTGKDTCVSTGYGAMKIRFGVARNLETKVYGIGPDADYRCAIISQDTFYNNPRGAVEILSIGSKTISGRIDAMVDSSTYVNGNFEVSVCN